MHPYPNLPNIKYRNITAEMQLAVEGHDRFSSSVVRVTVLGTEGEHGRGLITVRYDEGERKGKTEQITRRRVLGQWSAYQKWLLEKNAEAEAREQDRLKQLEDERQQREILYARLDREAAERELRVAPEQARIQAVLARLTAAGIQASKPAPVDALDSHWGCDCCENAKSHANYNGFFAFSVDEMNALLDALGH